MKTLSLYLFLLVAITFSVIACKNDTPQSLLVNTWKLTEWILVPSMEMNDTLKTQLMKSTQMEFTGDQLFVFEGMSPTPLRGTYALNTEGTAVTFSPDNAETSYTHTIAELTATKLVLIDQQGNKLVFAPQGE